ncbi:hypothetical protein C7H85_06360 [Zobellella endophytica]|uniref:Uncharacterized protein n=1 Tax=Zobellella endophytica TaxID=2116700 RepID=A0A2P7R7V3_9GAMM|nr:hypothetical protein C7H85_06360 [Zobellella endophytica]
MFDLFYPRFIAFPPLPQGTAPLVGYPETGSINPNVGPVSASAGIVLPPPGISFHYQEAGLANSNTGTFTADLRLICPSFAIGLGGIRLLGRDLGVGPVGGWQRCGFFFFTKTGPGLRGWSLRAGDNDRVPASRISGNGPVAQ